MPGKDTAQHLAAAEVAAEAALDKVCFLKWKASLPFQVPDESVFFFSPSDETKAIKLAVTNAIKAAEIAADKTALALAIARFNHTYRKAKHD
ncbi:MAG: hypothetical protein V3R78_12520 [Thermodesulfobacteriota bacterium]